MLEDVVVVLLYICLELSAVLTDGDAEIFVGAINVSHSSLFYIISVPLAADLPAVFGDNKLVSAFIAGRLFAEVHVSCYEQVFFVVDEDDLWAAARRALEFFLFELFNDPARVIFAGVSL